MSFWWTSGGSPSRTSGLRSKFRWGHKATEPGLRESGSVHVSFISGHEPPRDMIPVRSLSSKSDDTDSSRDPTFLETGVTVEDTEFPRPVPSPLPFTTTRDLVPRT